MIGKLQIKFSLHAIAGQLGIARQRLVFFVQLGGIAALTIVLAIAVITRIRRTRSAAAATAPAAGLTIVDQTLIPRFVVLFSHFSAGSLPAVHLHKPRGMAA